MENIDLIDRYFKNSLSPKDQKLFNELLQNDPEFKEEFVFQKDLKKVLSSIQNDELKSTLSNFEEVADKRSYFFSIPKKWLVAASIMLVFALGLWGVKSTFYPSNEALYAEYFQADENTVVPIVRGEEIHSIEYRAFVAYEEENHHKAINLFNSISNPEQTYILYYKALCYMSLDKFEEASNLMNQVVEKGALENEFSNFETRAHWYMALAHIKMGNNTEAIDELNRVIDQQNSVFKKKEAQKLKSYLE